MTRPSRVLVGGVGYRWFGDASFGLAVTDAMSATPLPAGVEVDDLGYGALLVAMDLADADPAYERMILVTAVARGREPGRLYRSRWQGVLPDPGEVQARLREAGSGAIDIDHLLVVAEHFGALPSDVVSIEFEPLDTTTRERLSPKAYEVLPEALTLVRAEATKPRRPVSARGGDAWTPQ